MKYLAQTFSYLKRGGWLPLVAMLIPSVAACFLSTPYWEVAFVAAFDYNPYISASATFAVLFGDSWQYVWPVLVVAVLQVFGAALTMSCMDRHFRTGRLSLRSPWRMINNSIFPLAIGVAVMSVMSIILRFLLFGLVMLVQVICSSAGFSAGVALAIISVIAVGMFVLHVMIITPVLFWAPIMFVYGYKFRDAAASSFKMLSGKKVFGGLFLPMLFCAGIQLLLGLLQAHIAVVTVIGFVVFLITNVYATAYTMLVFYGISELERRDLAPYRDPLPVIKKAEPAPKIAAAAGVSNDEAPKQNQKSQKQAPAKQKQKHRSDKTSAIGRTDAKLKGEKSDQKRTVKPQKSKNVKAAAKDTAPETPKAEEEDNVV